MTASPAYRKAPITEAVIDLRVRTQAKISDLENLAKKLAGKYPERTEMSGVEVRIDGNAKNVGVKQSLGGYRAASKDQANVCILAPAGLTTARLAPYMGWEALEDDARRNWELWCKVTRSTQVSRIGVRYINRIDVPKTKGPDERIAILDYVKMRPEFPPISSHPLLGFALQVSARLDVPNWTVNLNTGTIIPAPLIDHVSFLLDIDIYREAELPSNEKKLWEVVGEARGIKNELFEKMVTDESRKLFQ